MRLIYIYLGIIYNIFEITAISAYLSILIINLLDID